MKRRVKARIIMNRGVVDSYGGVRKGSGDN
jgi:hypothetical protein